MISSCANDDEEVCRILKCVPSSPPPYRGTCDSSSSSSSSPSPLPALYTSPCSFTSCLILHADKAVQPIPRTAPMYDETSSTGGGGEEIVPCEEKEDIFLLDVSFGDALRVAMCSHA